MTRPVNLKQRKIIVNGQRSSEEKKAHGGARIRGGRRANAVTPGRRPHGGRAVGPLQFGAQPRGLALVAGPGHRSGRRKARHTGRLYSVRKSHTSTGKKNDRLGFHGGNFVTGRWCGAARHVIASVRRHGTVCPHYGTNVVLVVRPTLL